MIYKLDSGNNEDDRVGQQWVVIYEHEISSSSMKNGRLHKATFTSNMKKGWLRKAAFYV